MRFAKNEEEAVVSIPDVVRMAVVAVQPHFVLVVFNVEHVQTAVRIDCV